MALITDALTTAPLSLHFTFLERDGSGKAPVEPKRLYLAGHPKSGGVVRLWPDAETTHGLCIGEGIETTLSAARGFQPAWATLDAGNMAAFPVLDGIESLTILADHDAAGHQAKETCAARWHEAGREVRVWRADESGHDFNDWAAA